MDTFALWLNDNWQSLVAALGIGGGGGFLGKKLTDKEQNKKISELEGKVSKIEGSLKENELKDESTQNELKEFKSDIKDYMGKIDTKIDMLVSHLLNK